MQRAMLSNRFRISTVHLMYSLDTKRWYLVNGQHRLWSVRRADVAIDFDVITEIVGSFSDVEAAYISHDRGRNRSISQLINALSTVGDTLNQTQFTKLCAATGVLLTGFGPERKVNRPLNTVERRMELAFAVTDQAVLYYNAIANRHKTIIMRQLDTALITAFGIATFLAFPERAVTFWAAVAEGDDEEFPKDAPEIAVSKEVLPRDMAPHLKAKQLAACWNSAVDGRPTPRMSNRLMIAPISIHGTAFDGQAPMRFTLVADEVKVVPFGYEGDA
jgi:hypothetical protein